MLSDVRSSIKARRSSIKSRRLSRKQGNAKRKRIISGQGIAGYPGDEAQAVKADNPAMADPADPAIASPAFSIWRKAAIYYLISCACHVLLILYLIA